MKIKCGIYRIRNVDNEECYIGSAVNIGKRWWVHRRDLRSGAHANKHLQNAWNKYGEEKFAFEILEEFLNKSFLIRLEQYYIDNLEPEYNICPNAGSSLDVKRSNEFRQKMKKPKSVEHKQALSRAQKEYFKNKENHPMYGKHHSEAVRMKMSIAHRGIAHSEETKRIIGEQSRIRNAGRQNPMFGLKHSEETKERMKESQAKRRLKEKIRGADTR